jgi:4-hydroxy-3-polyprenylbenzoate decarboxylase
MEGLSYKAAIISIDKSYPGQARRAALAFWTALPQFTYTKFVIVVDQAINIRDPRQVMWAVTSKGGPGSGRVHPAGESFRSPGFCHREAGSRQSYGHRCHHQGLSRNRSPWSDELHPDPETAAQVDRRWAEYGLGISPSMTSIPTCLATISSWVSAARRGWGIGRGYRGVTPA